VVQVYVRRNNDPEAPNKSLRAFRRIHLKAGETWPVELTITPEAFEFYDGNVDGLVMKPEVIPSCTEEHRMKSIKNR
jgi:beta-glucosidase